MGAYLFSFFFLQWKVILIFIQFPVWSWKKYILQFCLLVFILFSSTQHTVMYEESYEESYCMYTLVKLKESVLKLNV